MLDDRSIRFSDKKDATIKDLYDRNRDLTDRYFEAVQRAVTLAEKQAAMVMDAVNNLQQKHSIETARLAVKSDDAMSVARAALEQVSACRADHHNCTAELQALKAHVTSKLGPP